MATSYARTRISISSATTKSILNRFSSSIFQSKATKLTGLPSTNPAASSRLTPHKLTNFRLPVELAGVHSLMPLHSVTASALLTSLLSLHSNSWGCLSEGFATPL